MGLVFHIAADLCNCCRSSSHHDKTTGKTVDDYPVIVAQLQYDASNRENQQKIPHEWICGECNKRNAKGKEFCIFCDQKYKPEYRVTVEQEGEDDHVPDSNDSNPPHSGDSEIVYSPESPAECPKSETQSPITPESVVAAASDPEPGSAEFVE